jgi:hypothetical protein
VTGGAAGFVDPRLGVSARLKDVGVLEATTRDLAEMNVVLGRPLPSAGLLRKVRKEYQGKMF